MTHSPEFDVLAEQLFLLSQDLLEKADGFYPHGAFVGPDGAHEILAVQLDGHPDPRDVHQALLAFFKENVLTKGYRAIGVAADGRVSHPSGGEKQDAILVFLEAPAGPAITIAMHYKKSAEGYEYAPTFGFKRDPEVFQPPSEGR